MLHNIFVRLKDEWEFEDLSDSDDSNSDSDSVDGEENFSHDCSGAQFQDAIRDRWLRSNGWAEDV
jgi:hypothetical protein